MPIEQLLIECSSSAAFPRHPEHVVFAQGYEGGGLPYPPWLPKGRLRVSECSWVEFVAGLLQVPHTLFRKSHCRGPNFFDPTFTSYSLLSDLASPLAFELGASASRAAFEYLHVHRNSGPTRRARVAPSVTSAERSSWPTCTNRDARREVD